MKKQMIANRRFTYGTRRLTADDLFQATVNDAKVLVALGHARIVEGTPEKPATPAKQASQPVQQPVQSGADDDSDDANDDDSTKDPKAALVAEAQSLGIEADETWGMKRLRKEIKAAKAK